MVKPIAATFALLFAFAPAAAFAQTSAAPRGAGSAYGSHMRTRDARRARPWYRQVPPADQNLPAISRDPDDCVKTMCTCLAGGGC